MPLALVVAFILAGVFSLSYVLNGQTEKPADCLDLLQDCHSCTIATCGHNHNVKS